MKKALSLLLILAMMVSALSMLAVPSLAAEATSTVLGDLNGDGKITAVDSLLLKKFVAGMSVTVIEANADVNGDGKISVLDTGAMKRYIAGAVNDFKDSSTYRVKQITIGGVPLSEFSIGLFYPYDAGKTEKNSYYAYQKAAQYLNIYLNAACGTSITRAYDSSYEYGIYMWVDENLDEEEFKIQTMNGSMYIWGGERRGCLYAVMHIIQEYVGWRFYEYEQWICYPNDLIDIPMGIDYSYNPQMEYRDVHTHAFVIDNGGNDNTKLLNCANRLNSHTDRAYMQSGDMGYGEGNVWINAHSFGYIFDGLGHSNNPCLTDYMSRITISNWLINLLDERQTWGTHIGVELQRVSSSWNDTENYCMCSNCVYVYQYEKSIAGTIVRMNNQVTQDINAKYPSIEVYYIAYGSNRIPPAHSVPGYNQVVCYCWNGCNNHTFDSDECSDEGNTLGFTNWEERYYFEAWARLCPGTTGRAKLFAWYYASTFVFDIAPCPNILNIREDFRYLAEHGVVGIYAEAHSANKSFEPLRNYLMALCMWDPYISEEKFEREIDMFLETYYGDGWRLIKEYLYLQDEAGNRAGCFVNNHDWPGDMYDTEFMWENYDRIVEIFDTAYNEAIENNWQNGHVLNLSAHAKFLAVCGAFKAGEGQTAKAQAAYEDAYNTVKAQMPALSYFCNIPSYHDGSQSPMVYWLELNGIDGTWYEYFGNGTLPRDNPNYFHYYLPVEPTKDYNPCADIGIG